MARALLFTPFGRPGSLQWPVRNNPTSTTGPCRRREESTKVQLESNDSIHTAIMAQVNWRTINIDALDPESSSNFDLSTLTPAVQPVSSSDVQALSGQIRQLWRGGDAEGALRGALENAPYGADAQSKDSYMQTVTEVLQQIRTADMGPLLQRIYQSDGGSELCDVLMKYL